MRLETLPLLASTLPENVSNDERNTEMKKEFLKELANEIPEVKGFLFCLSEKIIKKIVTQQMKLSTANK